MQQRRLGVLESCSRVTSQAELPLAGLDVQTHVWVLIDSARNQARDITPCAKDVRERVGKGRSRLHSSKVVHANVVAVGEAKDVAALVESDRLGDSDHVLVECTTVRQQVLRQVKTHPM